MAIQLQPSPIISLMRRRLFSCHPELYFSTTLFPFTTASKPRHIPNPKPAAKTKTFSHIYQECAANSALNPGKQAHGWMIVSGFSPTVFVSNCLVQFYVKCRLLEYAFKVFERMPHWDVVSHNSLIFGYAGCGKMGAARRVFDEMSVRDVVSWNSMISGFSQNGECGKAVGIFVEMGRAGVGFDQSTFAVVLKSCASMEDTCVGVQVHGVVVRLGFCCDVVAGSALVDMYAKCKRMDESIQVFFEMPEKNWVSWSALIAGCVQNDLYNESIDFFIEMQRMGVGVSQSVYATIFKACAGLSALRVGNQLHCHAIKSDLQYDVIVGTATLDMYAKCGSIADAHKVFNSLPKHNLQSFNAIITGYVRSNQGFEAWRLFRLLLRSGLGFNEISLSGAFSACALMKGISEGLQLHGLTVKGSQRSSICVLNSIIDMYGKCGAVAEASYMFHEMNRRDAISWNAIIAAHEQNGDEEETLCLLALMLHSRMEPDDFTYGSVLKACAGRQASDHGMAIHGRIIKAGMGLDSFVGGALVDMYCKCGLIEEAERVHCGTEEKTTVSWNAMISGFTSLRQSEDAQKRFSQMLELGFRPDNFTYAAILDTCANLATVSLGKQIHGQIIKQKLQSEVHISSTLVDMYSKCGNLQDARLIFEGAVEKDFITWNAMICGYVHHGFGEEALDTYETMQSKNMEPNHATFVSVLRVCAHMGLVEKAMHYFDYMQSKHGLAPQLEHFSCMVDILGRSGRINDALELIREMPVEADDVIWRTLLDSCRVNGNVEIAEQAASSILELCPQDSSTYVLLSNIYADAGMWDEVSATWKKMRYNKLKKEPAYSWIEVKDELHAFLVGDQAHPLHGEIYDMLEMLILEMKKPGHVPGIGYLLDEEAQETEQQEESKFDTCNRQQHSRHIDQEFCLFGDCGFPSRRMKLVKADRQVQFSGFSGDDGSVNSK